MTQPLLEKIVADVETDAPNWTTFDFENFSQHKRLWDYQQNALIGAMKALWKYYEDFRNYQSNEVDNYDDVSKNANNFRKGKLHACYEDNGLTENLGYTLKKDAVKILEDFFPIDGDKIKFKHFINRMSFWMATGSGKTLVIVKLIHLLHTLITRGEIPENDILVLAHKDELIEQFRVHVSEFNQANFGVYIRLHDLKDYSNIKRSNPSLFSGDELNVFTYRSDNLTTAQKDKQIDFRNYENGGRWYVLLDEAHKGDKEESKRQHIFSVLSRNGFLFNFSATFTDPRDIYTTVSNFNLAEFISKGYGKHISILNQQILAFKNKAEDFTGEEKQKIVLQSLLALTVIGKQSEKVRVVRKDLFHKPLLITLVNSVNTEDADLKLFFRELERIAKGDVSDELFQAAKAELWNEFKDGVSLMFETDKFLLNEAEFAALTIKDVRKEVFNSKGTGAIEVVRRPSDRKEIAFKIQSAEKPFALIKIGDISDWLKTDLIGYEIIETFDDEGYFENLNKETSDIKILMGSRTFYEGWDSNRPNVINFINIGTGTDAKKFVLQSIGRGVRVEPLPNKRRRLANLKNANLIDEKTFQAVKKPSELLETLLIFGTNRNALEKVVEELKKEKTETTHIIELDKNTDITLKPLLIPVYKSANHPIITQKTPKRFEVVPEEINTLQNYMNFVGDDAVLLLRHRTTPKDFQGLEMSLADESKFYEKDKDARQFKNIGLLWKNLIGYFNVIPKEFEGFKELDNEISHYKKILVTMEDVTELKQKIDKVKNFKSRDAQKAGLIQKLKNSEISEDEFFEMSAKVGETTKDEETFEYKGERIKIKRLASHYYLPSITSKEEKIDFIKHIIKVESEKDFLDKLQEYLDNPNNKMTEFDDWAFSKLDESLDNVVIPYVNKIKNQISNFNPDFIFWLKHGQNYSIVFVDPKGAQHTDYGYKIDGYEDLFKDGNTLKTFSYKGLNVRVFVFLYNKNAPALTNSYRDYWIDKMDDVIEKILAEI